MDLLLRGGGSERPTNPFKRVHDFNNIGLKILTMGIIPPQEFLGGIRIEHVILYVIVHLSLTVFGVYELVASIMLSESFIELLSHWYVVAYCWCYAFQFTYACGIFKEISQEDFGNEHFQTTKMVPERAEEILNRNLDDFKRFSIVFAVIVGGTSLTYSGGAIIQAVIELITTGTVQQIFILSYYSNVPLWGQALVTITNVFTLVVCVATTTSIFMVTGIRALRIKTQCEIISEALTLANVDINRCIQDHVELIRIARRTMEIFRILNEPQFTTLYLSLAIQLLNLLESLGVSAYFSPWCAKNQSFAKNIIPMTLMAQRPLQQRLWLNSLTIERGTTLRIVQSAYSFYTLLMIFQARN